MGQYHFPVNLDKHEYLNPHDLGDGLKALEQALSGPGGVPTALHALLTVSNGRGGGDYRTGVTYRYDPDLRESVREVDEEFEGIAEVVLGRWGGDRIAIVGDYAEPGDIPKAEGIEPVLYSLCGSAESVAESIAFWEERAAEGFEKDAAIYGVPPEEYQRYAQLAREWGPFTDITPLVIAYLSNCDGPDTFTYSGTGWRDRKFAYA